MKQESRKNKILRKNQNVFRTDKEYLSSVSKKNDFKKTKRFDRRGDI